MSDLAFALEAYNNWLSSDYFDETTKAELKSLEGNNEEIEDRFYTELEFGTAGLRGVIGAGTNRMNIYTVRKATQGLANFIIKQNAANKGVAIAYDSRHFSPEFALEAALCLAANGVKAFLFDELRPTPELSFAVRFFGCIAGINVTASHNPAKYNGYKVYWADGAQITPPYDTGIMDEVKAVTDYNLVKTMDKETAIKNRLLTYIGKEVDDAYIAELKKQVKEPEAINKFASKVKVVYTPLHGTGNKPVRRILAELGFNNVYVVPEQELPDGAFPTVELPNPEFKESFELGLQLAREKDADLILATDPDADRIGVYIKDRDGEYHSLTGNESGGFLADYELGRIKAHGNFPEDGRLISTIVSGKMGRTIAAYYGATYVECLTGFKYIGEQIRNYEHSGVGTYLFGYEESYGSLIGTYARDKDAVVASMALCEACAYYMSIGKNMWDAFVDMQKKYGYFKEGVNSYSFEGISGKEQMDEIIKRLRKENPEAFGRFRVLAKRDYGISEKIDMLTGRKSKLDLPKSQVIYYELPDDAWCCVRPSGTEPKIKVYYGVKGISTKDSENILEELKKAFSDYLNI